MESWQVEDGTGENKWGTELPTGPREMASQRRWHRWDDGRADLIGWWQSWEGIGIGVAFNSVITSWNFAKSSWESSWPHARHSLMAFSVLQYPPFSFSWVRGGEEHKAWSSEFSESWVKGRLPLLHKLDTWNLHTYCMHTCVCSNRELTSNIHWIQNTTLNHTQYN